MSKGFTIGHSKNKIYTKTKTWKKNEQGTFKRQDDKIDKGVSQDPKPKAIKNDK